MSPLKQQLLLAAIDSLLISILTGMVGGAALAWGTTFPAIVLIIASGLNINAAITRFNLFREQK